MTSSDITTPAPKRAMGLVDVIALGVNCVIGSGIFLLPGLVAEGTGPASLLAVLAAGGLAFLVALCFAEASGHFSGSGGAYLYARAAFGDTAGFAVGWIAALAGVFAWAALVNAFAVALAHFVPAAGEGAGRVLAVLGLVTGFALLNVRGVAQMAAFTKVLTVAKLGALVAFVGLGARAVEGGRFTPFLPDGYGGLGQAVLLMMYAYVGFENLVVPAGEMKHPRRSVPLAILAIMSIVTVLYLLVQAVTIGTLDGLAGTRNAVAASATAFLGPVGGGSIAAAVLLSIVGVNAASALVLPRRFYALAEARDLPGALLRVHRRFGTPWVAVVATHALVAGAALTGSFRSLAVTAVVARVLQYAPTCLAVLALRRRTGADADGFRLPFGPVIPGVAFVSSLALLAAAEPWQLGVGALALVSGVPVWLWRRRAAMGDSQ